MSGERPPRHHHLPEKSSGAVAFEHVFTYFEQKYGQRKGMGIRAAWKALKMPTQGKLTLAQFRRFRLEFMQVWQQLPEVSESEAYRHLNDRLLPFMMDKVYKKEKDKNRNSKKLIVHPGMPVSEDDFKESVKGWVGVAPVEVAELEGGEFECTMGSDELVQALLMINQRRINGTPHKIKVRKAEVLLTVIEFFNLIEELMVDREELAVRKGVEARAHTVGAEREKPNNAPQRAPPQVPSAGGGSANSRGGWREQDPPYEGDPLKMHPRTKCFRCKQMGHYSFQCTNPIAPDPPRQSRGKGGAGGRARSRSPSANRSSSGGPEASSSSQGTSRGGPVPPCTPTMRGPGGLRGAEPPSAENNPPAHSACVGCTSMPSHVKSSFQCMSPGTCLKAPSFAQKGMSPAMEQDPFVDHLKHLRRRGSGYMSRRGGRGAHWVPLQEGGPPGRGEMGALSPHPTMGRCMKTCTPSRMRKKFLARIKKIRKKPF